MLMNNVKTLDPYSIRNPGNPGRLNQIFPYVLDWLLQVISRQLQVNVMNHKVNYGLIKSKIQIKTRNATRCNNRDDLLHLTFTLKISIFSEAIYNPIKHL